MHSCAQPDIESLGDVTETCLDWIDDLRGFFPLEEHDRIESDYFQRHLDSYISNQNSNNDYAILALHQLFMFCSYGLVYAVVKDRPAILQHAFTLSSLRSREERQQLQNIDSLFTFSLLNESTFFEAFALAGVSVECDMKPLKDLVKSRNTAAHCNGSSIINFNDDVNNYVRCFEIIHEKFTLPFTEIILRANKFNYKATKDVQIEELRRLLSGHYVSRNMLMRIYPIAQKTGLQKNADQLIKYYLSEL